MLALPGWPNRRHLFLTTCAILFIFWTLRALYLFPASPSRGSRITSEPAEHAAVDVSTHIIERLFLDAKSRHKAVVANQSKTLEAAEARYREKYGEEPPSGFDDWFSLAHIWRSPIVDEFDDIVAQLRPYRPFLDQRCDQSRLSDDECSKSRVIQLCFQDGAVDVSGWREDWFEETLREMMEIFRERIPNMCVYFNYKDEPRTLLPFESLTGDGSREQACQSLSVADRSKTDIRMQAYAACAPDAPARARKTVSRNLTLFNTKPERVMDICEYDDSAASGLLRASEGLFVSEAAVPVLSPSKMACFADVLFPSPFRFSTAGGYRAEEDVEWDSKEPALYWRGSTTGGHATLQNWRTLHRQALVSSLQDSHNEAIDVGFSAIIQCEDEACRAEESYFGLKEREDHARGWKYKFLLDMDGNGLSGRLYDLLKSQSLVLRKSFFKEWHEERLQPWYHYVPLTGDAKEVEEILAFFNNKRGDEIAREMAAASTEWTGRALRAEDMVLYLFRLLLEMARGR